MSHASASWTSRAVMVLSFLIFQVLAERGRHHHRSDHALDRSDLVRFGVTSNGLLLPTSNVELDDAQDADVAESDDADEESSAASPKLDGAQDANDEDANDPEGDEPVDRRRLMLSRGRAAQPEPAPSSTPLPMRHANSKGALGQADADVEQQPEATTLAPSAQPSRAASEGQEQPDQEQAATHENSQTAGTEAAKEQPDQHPVGQPESHQAGNATKLEDFGLDNVTMQDFTETDEASARLAEAAIDQAELNLEVIRKFPKMSLWETRLRQAISEAGAGAHCGELKDTMFRGYGCGIRDNDQPLCTCRGGHEDCQMHDSEDVLDYLWTVKQNKTVDENIMRELLAGRCDYLGGHAVSWFEVGAILGVVMIPAVFACVCCFAPIVMTKSALGSKSAAQKRPESRGSGSRRASPTGSARETPRAAEDA